MAKRSSKSHVEAMIERLAAEEQKFLEQEFLTPAVHGGVVRVRIGGVVCRLGIEPREFEGWGIFRPTSVRNARLVRQASLAERRKYLDLFPAVRLIVCRRQGAKWMGAAASFGDARLRIEGLAPIELAEEVQSFDVVACRYDGATFWFDELDVRRDAATAAYLRGALAERAEPGELDRRGLTAEERAAYELNYWELARPAAENEAPPGSELTRGGGRRKGDAVRAAAQAADPIFERLRENLSHAGARLIGYVERADSFRVTYRAGGQEFTSAVDKKDLSVQVAGICLSGEDRKFDLASLVGVLCEGDPEGGVLRIGNDIGGMPEEHYWRVHPPGNR